MVRLGNGFFDLRVSGPVWRYTRPSWSLRFVDPSIHRDVLRYGASRWVPVNVDACGFANGCSAQMTACEDAVALG